MRTCTYTTWHWFIVVCVQWQKLDAVREELSDSKDQVYALRERVKVQINAICCHGRVAACSACGDSLMCKFNSWTALIAASPYLSLSFCPCLFIAAGAARCIG